MCVLQEFYLPAPNARRLTRTRHALLFPLAPTHPVRTLCRWPAQAILEEKRAESAAKHAEMEKRANKIGKSPLTKLANLLLPDDL